MCPAFGDTMIRDMGCPGDVPYPKSWAVDQVYSSGIGKVWRDGSAIKNIFCSSGGPRFGSQHVCNFRSRGCNAPLSWPSLALCLHSVHTYMLVKHPNP